MAKSRRQMTAAQREAKNARNRRYRQRDQVGLKAFTIVVDEVALSEKLKAAGFLSPLVADDHEQQRRALERMVSNLTVE